MKCKYCNNEIQPVKPRFNWGWFVIWLFMFYPAIFVQILMWATAKENKCPICDREVY